MGSSPSIRLERQGRVGIVTIHRPERHNSLDVRTAQDLRRAALELSRDEDVGVMVLRGQPGVFCSGVDLEYVRGGGEDDDLRYLVAVSPPEPGSGEGDRRFGAVFKQVLEYIGSTISEIRRAPKPVLAAVDGVAAAGGLGLALCCDLVFASQRSRFEWAYGKTGLSGAESATFFLPRLVGLRRALDIAFLGPRIDAAQALRLGLVSEVWPDEDFEHNLLEQARRLAEGPTAAYARMKDLLNAATGGDWLEDHLGREVESLVASANGDEFARGLERFFARRDGRRGE